MRMHQESFSNGDLLSMRKCTLAGVPQLRVNVIPTPWKSVFFSFSFTLSPYYTLSVFMSIRANLSTSAGHDIFPSYPNSTAVLCGLKIGPSRICAAAEGERRVNSVGGYKTVRT